MPTSSPIKPPISLPSRVSLSRSSTTPRIASSSTPALSSSSARPSAYSSTSIRPSSSRGEGGSGPRRRPRTRRWIERAASAASLSTACTISLTLRSSHYLLSSLRPALTKCSPSSRLLLHHRDPIAYMLNAAVDRELAKTKEPLAIANVTAGLMASLSETVGRGVGSLSKMFGNVSSSPSSPSRWRSDSSKGFISPSRQPRRRLRSRNGQRPSASRVASRSVLSSNRHPYSFLTSICSFLDRQDRRNSRAAEQSDDSRR